MTPDDPKPGRFRAEDFRPTRSSPSDSGETPKRGGSGLGLCLAFGFGFCLILGLIFLSASLAPVVIVAVAFVFVLFGGAALHYLIWGWWLGGMIRQDVEAEERDDAEREQRLRNLPPT